MNVEKLKQLTKHSVDELRQKGLVVPVNDATYKTTAEGDRYLELLERFGSQPLPAEIPLIRNSACDALGLPHDVEDWMLWLAVCAREEKPSKGKKTK